MESNLFLGRIGRKLRLDSLYPAHEFLCRHFSMQPENFAKFGADMVESLVGAHFVLYNGFKDVSSDLLFKLIHNSVKMRFFISNTVYGEYDDTPATRWVADSRTGVV